MGLLKRTVELAVSPVGIMTLLLGCGLVLSFMRRHAQAGRRLVLSGSLLYLVFMFTPLGELMTRGLERQYPPVLAPQALPRIDAVVVLSGYGEEHPSFPVTSNLSDETTCRLTEGVRLFRQIAGARMIVCGGVLRAGDKPVAGLMADFLHQIGVPPGATIIEGASRNTYENLVEIRKIVGESRFILVTSAYHLRRAVAVAERLGMKPLPAPACIRTLQHYPVQMGRSAWISAILSSFAHPSLDRLAMLQLAQHEYLGYIWYQLLGRI